MKYDECAIREVSARIATESEESRVITGGNRYANFVRVKRAEKLRIPVSAAKLRESTVLKGVHCQVDRRFRCHGVNALCCQHRRLSLPLCALSGATTRVVALLGVTCNPRNYAITLECARVTLLSVSPSLLNFCR